MSVGERLRPSNGLGSGQSTARPSVGRDGQGEGAPRVHTVRWRGPGWGSLVRAAWAAVEALLAGLLITIVPVAATYAATASSPELGAAQWSGALGVGVSVWLLGWGAAVPVAGAMISVLPLGLTALLALTLYASTKRARLSHPLQVVTVLAVYLGAVLVTAMVTDASGRGRLGWVCLLVILPTVLAASGTAWPRGAWSARWRALLRWERVPTWVSGTLRTAGRLAGRTMMILLTCGLVLVVVTTLWQWQRVMSVQQALSEGGIDPVSVAVLWFGQLLYAPTLGLWDVSLLAGPGYHFGAATFSSSGVTGAALPAIPLLGGLPTPDSLVANSPWLVVVPIVVGGWLGWRLWTSQAEHSATPVKAGSAGSPPPALTPLLVATALGVLASAIGMALLAALSNGSAGPGLLATAGVEPLPFGLALAGELTAGAAAVLGARWAWWRWKRGARPEMSGAELSGPAQSQVGGSNQ